MSYNKNSINSSRSELQHEEMEVYENDDFEVNLEEGWSVIFCLILKLIYLKLYFKKLFKIVFFI